MINTIFTLLTVIKGSWSNRQREVIADMLEHQDGQVNVARRLDTTVYGSALFIGKREVFPYKEALDTVGKVLGK